MNAETPKLTDEQAETIYALGHNAYENGQYAKAATIFNGLAATKKENAKYWMSLGSAQQRLKQYERAAQAFLFASALRPKEPESYTRAAECLWHLGKPEEALMTLQTAKSIAEKDKKKHYALLGQLELYQKAWSNSAKRQTK